jgi:uncharacterized protein YciI
MDGFRVPEQQFGRELSMRIRYLIPAMTLVLISLSVFYGQESAPAKAETSNMKSTFIAIYKPGPAWLPGKPLSEQPLREHGKYMFDLFSKNALKFAGPFLDDSGGAAVFEAAGEAEAKAIVANDPAVVSRVFVVELHPWRLVEWEKLLKK